MLTLLRRAAERTTPRCFILRWLLSPSESLWWLLLTSLTSFINKGCRTYSRSSWIRTHSRYTTFSSDSEIPHFQQYIFLQSAHVSARYIKLICLFQLFFGAVRTFGSNEHHPIITNFSQVFRLLSLHPPLKMATKGNCTDKANPVLISPKQRWATKRCQPCWRKKLGMKNFRAFLLISHPWRMPWKCNGTLIQPLHTPRCCFVLPCQICCEESFEVFRMCWVWGDDYRLAERASRVNFHRSKVICACSLETPIKIADRAAGCNWVSFRCGNQNTKGLRKLVLEDSWRPRRFDTCESRLKCALREIHGANT